jgi:uncharacterized membrane protein YtjA (UPF0391 family)
MLYSAIAFLAVGLVAGVLRLSGIAAVAGRAAWILLPIGAALIVVHIVTDRRAPPLS